MTHTSLISLVLLIASSLSGGCVQSMVLPLIGEDPEVSALLETTPVETPASSPLAAGRRLHQALVQGDADLAWSLLSTRTRELLNTKGAAIGVSGSELLEASTLPDASGKVVRVQFDEVLFGGTITEVAQADKPAPSSGRSVLRMSTKDGQLHERTFVLEGGDWKLEVTTL